MNQYQRDALGIIATLFVWMLVILFAAWLAVTNPLWLCVVGFIVIAGGFVLLGELEDKE